MVSKYKNSKAIPVHDGHYALNIKYYSKHFAMPNRYFEVAYEMAKEAFFNKAEQIVDAFGFKGVIVDGRSGGWLKPINDDLNPIKAVFDDYLSFEEFILEEKIFIMFELIEGQFKSIKKILEYSETLDYFIDTIERYMEI